MTPEPSQVQADVLADGVVTREEYLAGLDRDIACMEESGWSVGVIDREAEVVDYRIEAISGADDSRLCGGVRRARHGLANLPRGLVVAVKGLLSVT